jgi:hypothetical protein
MTPAHELGSVSLSAGRTLTIRTVTKADVEGLGALFEGLSDEDRYFRFFGLSHPAREFLEQLARAEDEGGYRLVAVVSGPQDKLVAEAGYAILPDGNGEFALTVAAGWRGWLGPFLLDAVVAAAAARGVPNLQADILASNFRMLALVSRRGYTTLYREGSELRVAVDAAQPRPRARSRGSLRSVRPAAPWPFARFGAESAVNIPLGDDHERAAGVMSQLSGDRAKQEPREPARAAGGDNQHVRFRRRPYQLIGGDAENGADLNRRRANGAELGKGLVGLLLRDRSRVPGQVFALGVAWPAAPETNARLVDGHQGDRDPSYRRFSHSPVDRSL